MRGFVYLVLAISCGAVLIVGGTVAGVNLIESQQQQNELQQAIKALIKVNYVQHQEFIPKDDTMAWLRRFCIGYQLQKEFQLWPDEEWGLIVNNDLPDYFRYDSGAISTWRGSMRKYWPEDTQKFIDGIIEKVEGAK